MNKLIAGSLPLLLAAWVAAPRAQPLLERGRGLMNDIAACGNCHRVRGENGRIRADQGPAGGVPFLDAGFEVHAANPTPTTAPSAMPT